MIIRGDRYRLRSPVPPVFVFEGRFCFEWPCLSSERNDVLHFSTSKRREERATPTAAVCHVNLFSCTCKGVSALERSIDVWEGAVCFNINNAVVV